MKKDGIFVWPTKGDTDTLSEESLKSCIMDDIAVYIPEMAWKNFKLGKHSPSVESDKVVSFFTHRPITTLM